MLNQQLNLILRHRSTVSATVVKDDGAGKRLGHRKGFLICADELEHRKLFCHAFHLYLKRYQQEFLITILDSYLYIFVQRWEEEE